MTRSLKHTVLAAALALASLAAHAQSPSEDWQPLPWAPDVPVAATPGIGNKLLARGQMHGLQTVDLRGQRRNDILVVQAEVRNTDTKDVRLYYRFRWLDEAGFQVGDGEVWKPVVFLGKQSQMLRGIAYGPQATDFRIEMSAEPR